MDRKVISLSITSVLCGMALSVVSAILPGMKEQVNYVGATMILGGGVFLDQAVMTRIFGTGKPPKRSLLRLLVYFLLAIVFMLLPERMAFAEFCVRLLRAIGTAFLLLALLKFFIFTTMEEQSLHD